MTPPGHSSERRPVMDQPGLLATLVTGLVGVLCAVVAALVVGRAGLVGALAAVVVVLAFFGSAAAPLRLVEMAALPIRAGMGLVLLTYVMRLVLVLGLLAVLSTVEGVDHPALGLTLIACALVWPLVRLFAVVSSSRLRPPAAPSRP